jgi:hypothetical protein
MSIGAVIGRSFIDSADSAANGFIEFMPSASAGPSA